MTERPATVYGMATNPVRDISGLSPDSLTRGERVIQFIERYCIIPEGDKVGQPVRLAYFQKLFIIDVYDNPHVTDTALLSIARKNAKALPVDTLIPTPSGYMRMGDLKVGSVVYGSSGNPVNVITKSKTHIGKDCYRIEWDDGSETLSTCDHLWAVRVGGMQRSWRTVDTEWIYESKKNTNQSIAIPLCEPVDYPEKDLPVNPYLLGAWLGDGRARGAAMYTGDQDVHHFIMEMEGIFGHPIKAKKGKRAGDCYEIRLGDGVANRGDKTKLSYRLRQLGLLNNKHIPEIYLLGSARQRWALLQGLMDTDGTVILGSGTPRCVFVQKDRFLCQQVAELARSLGLKASLKERHITANNSPYPYWCVAFNAYNDQPVFRMKRKQDRLKPRPDKPNRSSFRYVKSIEKCESVPCECIQVDAADSLYICGRNYVVTHNTGTIAFLMLAHLVGPEAVQNSRIVSGAMSREQAAEVYNLASKCVALSPDLRDIIKPIPSGKKLVGLPMNVEYQAISAEGKTAHGKSPILAILDEVGQIRGPQSDFVDAITTAQGAYENPLLIYISTQAANDADLFSIAIDDALTNKPPKTVCHLYSADKDASLIDEAAWYAANPALGLFRSMKDMRKQAEKAARMPSFENTFRNLNLNQRVSMVSPFVSKSAWEENGSAVPELDPDEPVYVGLDLSKRTDLTAMVIVQFVGKWNVYPYFWCPEKGLLDRAKRDRQPYDVWARSGHLKTTPGATVDYEYVAREMAELLEDLHVAGVAFDRWRMDVMQKELDEIGAGFPMIAFGQGFRDMSPALDTLEAELLNSRLAHGMHPVLTMCAANAVETRDPAGNRKLDKHKATGRIDGMVALAMAMGVTAKSDADTESVYESRGLIEIEY